MGGVGGRGHLSIGTMILTVELDGKPKEVSCFVSNFYYSSRADG